MAVDPTAARDTGADLRVPSPDELWDGDCGPAWIQDAADRAQSLDAPAVTKIVGAAPGGTISDGSERKLSAGDRLREAARTVLDRLQDFAGDGDAMTEDGARSFDGHVSPAVARLRAALAAAGPDRDGWRPVETAPYGQEVEVRAGMMRFRAELVRDGSINEDEKPCDQWRATREGEHPPCWSGGSCWESNEDLSPSLQPDAWRSVPPAPPAGVQP